MKSNIRLPKLIEREACGSQLVEFLERRKQLLWSRGALAVPVIELTSELSSVLAQIQLARQLVRGLEGVERVLNAEEKGLRQVDETTNNPRGVRVSRLILLSNDGGNSFYRQVERLLLKHAGRALALKLDTGGQRLGELLFGAGQLARLLLVSHKQAVAAALLALIES